MLTSPNLISLIFFYLLSLFTQANEPWPVRQERIVQLNPNFLVSKSINSSLEQKQYKLKNTFQANLFEEYPWVLVRDKESKESKTDKNIWVGKIVSDSQSIAVFAIDDKNGQLAGQIVTNNKVFTIRPIKGDQYKIIEQDTQDQSFDLDDFIPIYSSLRKKIKTKTNSTTLSTLGSNVIDILVAYTDDVASNSINVPLEIQADIALVNQIYARSCTNVQFRLVGTQQVFYNEFGVSSDDLTQLSSNGDGVLDEVLINRDVLGADLVMLWVENSNLCGLGYAPTSPSNPAYGFSLRLHACNSMTSAHEIGHNLGLTHDRYQQSVAFGDENAPYKDGYGHVNLTTKIYTVMSYSSHCSSMGLNCTRIPYFSNPDIFYLDNPLGFFKTQNESRKINESSQIVSTFKREVTPATYSPTVSCQASTLNDKSKFCFVATVGFGGSSHPVAKYFRFIRDHYLMKTYIGRAFIEYYYENGPILAAIIASTPLFIYISKIILLSVYFFMKNFGLLFLMIFLSLLSSNLKAQLASARLTPESRYEQLSPANLLQIPNRTIYAVDYNYGKGNEKLSDTKLLDITSIKKSSLILSSSFTQWAILSTWVPKQTKEETNTFSSISSTQHQTLSDFYLGISYKIFAPLVLSVDYDHQTDSRTIFPDNNVNNTSSLVIKRDRFRGTFNFAIFESLFVAYRLNIEKKCSSQIVCGNNYSHEFGIGSYMKTSWGAYSAYVDYHLFPKTLHASTNSLNNNMQESEKKYRYGGEVFLKNDFFIPNILNDFNLGLFYSRGNVYGFSSNSKTETREYNSFQVGFLAFSQKGLILLRREEFTNTKQNLYVQNITQTSIIFGIQIN